MLKSLFKILRIKKDKIKSEITNNMCPRCGSMLKERSGKHGSFLGCNSFPRCRFTIDIN